MALCAASEEVILFIDVNENIYTGPLATALIGDGLRMEEQTIRLTGKEASHSHCTGKCQYRFSLKPTSTYMSLTLARLCGEWQLVSKNYEAWSGKSNYSRYE